MFRKLEINDTVYDKALKKELKIVGFKKFNFRKYILQDLEGKTYERNIENLEILRKYLTNLLPIDFPREKDVVGITDMSMKTVFNTYEKGQQGIVKKIINPYSLKAKVVVVFEDTILETPFSCSNEGIFGLNQIEIIQREHLK